MSSVFKAFGQRIGHVFKRSGDHEEEAGPDHQPAAAGGPAPAPAAASPEPEGNLILASFLSLSEDAKHIQDAAEKWVQSATQAARDLEELQAALSRFSTKAQAARATASASEEFKDDRDSDSVASRSGAVGMGVPHPVHARVEAEGRTQLLAPLAGVIGALSELQQRAEQHTKAGKDYSAAQAELVGLQRRRGEGLAPLSVMGRALRNKRSAAEHRALAQRQASARHGKVVRRLLEAQDRMEALGSGLAGEAVNWLLHFPKLADGLQQATRAHAAATGEAVNEACTWRVDGGVDQLATNADPEVAQRTAGAADQALQSGAAQAAAGRQAAQDGAVQDGVAQDGAAEAAEQANTGPGARGGPAATALVARPPHSPPRKDRWWLPASLRRGARGLRRSRHRRIVRGIPFPSRFAYCLPAAAAQGSDRGGQAAFQPLRLPADRSKRTWTAVAAVQAGLFLTDSVAPVTFVPRPLGKAAVSLAVARAGTTPGSRRPSAVSRGAACVEENDAPSDSEAAAADAPASHRLLHSRRFLRRLAHHLEVDDVARLGAVDRRLRFVTGTDRALWMGCVWRGGVPAHLRIRFWEYVTGMQEGPDRLDRPAWSPTVGDEQSLGGLGSARPNSLDSIAPVVGPAAAAAGAAAAASSPRFGPSSPGSPRALGVGPEEAVGGDGIASLPRSPAAAAAGGNGGGEALAAALASLRSPAGIRPCSMEEYTALVRASLGESQLWAMEGLEPNVGAGEPVPAWAVTMAQDVARTYSLGRDFGQLPGGVKPGRRRRRSTLARVPDVEEADSHRDCDGDDHQGANGEREEDEQQGGSPAAPEIDPDEAGASPLIASATPPTSSAQMPLLQVPVTAQEMATAVGESLEAGFEQVEGDGTPVVVTGLASFIGARAPSSGSQAAPDTGSVASAADTVGEQPAAAVAAVEEPAPATPPSPPPAATAASDAPPKAADSPAAVVDQGVAEVDEEEAFQFAVRHALRGRLYRLLMAAAQAFEVRYVQGLNFVARLLLHYCTRHPRETLRKRSASGTDPAASPQGSGQPAQAGCWELEDAAVPVPGEERAFNLLRTLFESRGLARLYARDLGRVGLLLYQCEQVMSQHCPKLQGRLRELSVSTSMFATGWLITLFSRFSAMPPSEVCIVWDAFICGGWLEMLKAVGLLAAALEPEVEASMGDASGPGRRDSMSGGLEVVLPILMAPRGVLRPKDYKRMRTKCATTPLDTPWLQRTRAMWVVARRAEMKREKAAQWRKQQEEKRARQQQQQQQQGQEAEA